MKVMSCMCVSEAYLSLRSMFGNLFGKLLLYRTTEKWPFLPSERLSKTACYFRHASFEDTFSTDLFWKVFWVTKFDHSCIWRPYGGDFHACSGNLMYLRFFYLLISYLIALQEQHFLCLKSSNNFLIRCIDNVVTLKWPREKQCSMCRMFRKVFILFGRSLICDMDWLKPYKNSVSFFSILQLYLVNMLSRSDLVEMFSNSHLKSHWVFAHYCI